MKYLDILRSNRAALEEKRTAALDEIESRATTAQTEERAIKPEEQVEIDALFADVRAAEAEIAKLDNEIAEFEAVEQRTLAAAKVPVVNRPAPGSDPAAGIDVRYMRPIEARDAAMRVMEDKENVRHLRADQLDKLDGLLRTSNGDTDGAVIAKRMLVTESPEYRSAFQKLLTQSVPALTADEAAAVQRFQEFRAASLTSGNGGYGVPVLIDPTIVITSQGSLNPFRRISRVITITNDQWKGVSSVGMTWSYDGEATEVSDDAATLAQPAIPTFMARGFIPFSVQIGMDYPNFAGEMGALLNSGYDELQASAFATGNGTSAPMGILTALDADTAVEVVVTTDGLFGAVDINKVWGALPDRFKQNATWMMNHDVGNEVSSFSTSGAGSFFTNTLAGTLEKIRNRPVEFASYFGDFTGTTGASNLVVVGDFRYYYIVERAGMDVELVPHLFGSTTSVPTSQRGLLAWARHGAEPVTNNAFRLLQNQ